MSHKRIAAVTGANKGIGLAIGASFSPLTRLDPGISSLDIVRNLALQYPASPFNSGPFLIYLTVRDKAKGEDALKSIQSDSKLKGARALTQDGGLTTVKYHQLDISDEQSIKSFSSFLGEEHPQGIDMLINNAGVAMRGFGQSHKEQAS